jgi:hypothetical protein
MRIVVLTVFLFLISLGNGRSIEPLKVIDADSILLKLDDLRVELALRKSYPSDLELPFLTALSYYPELSDKKITVRYRDIKTTMQCRPSLLSFFRRKEKRDYRIYVDNKKKNNEGVLYDELSFNAKVGIFGHELAHVVDFETKTNFDVIRFGVVYLNHDKRREIENDIDMIAIHRGLGYQLNDFATYVFEESEVSEKYLKFKRKYYFQPFQMRRIIAHIPLYQ